jgi:tRNA(Ile)-lysidine synthetase-like protein
MENKIKEIIKVHGLDKAVSVVAVSGGIDSMVLLDLLRTTLAPSHLIVAHIDHGLRKASPKEAEAVRTLTESHGIRYREKKLSLSKTDEATSRTERYRWLKELADEEKAAYIITAHHLDDQLETVIMNLVRGTGPLEIWGMRELEGNILRPLLSFSRTEIENYTKEHGLKFFDDKSNQDVDYTRNRIRLRVIPELKKINPSLYQVFVREYKLGQEAQDFLELETDNALQSVVSDNRVNLEAFLRLPSFIRKELIKRLLHKFSRRPADIYQKNVEAVLALIDKKGSKKTFLSDLMIEKTYKELIFDSQNLEIEESKSLGLGETEFNGFTFILMEGIGTANKKRILLPKEFSGNLRVRNWHPGDKIKTNYGTKKVQDLFVDAKIDRRERSRWPIVMLGDEILWVPLLQAAKIDKTNNKLILEVK